MSSRWPRRVLATFLIGSMRERMTCPHQYGIVGSLNRPQGNVTGAASSVEQLEGKQLDLLLELVPQATIVGYLLGSSSAPVFENLRNDMLAAARALKREIIDRPIDQVIRQALDH